MTLEKAREMLKVQAGFGGFYNRNAAKLILAEVSREHGQEAVDRLITELELTRHFGFEPGDRFEGGLVIKKTNKSA
jgi:hypothetical protein